MITPREISELQTRLARAEADRDREAAKADDWERMHSRALALIAGHIESETKLREENARLRAQISQRISP